MKMLKRRSVVRGLAIIAFSQLSVLMSSRETQADYAYAWGKNDAGELGNGTYSPSEPFGNQSSPAPVTVLSSGVTMVAAGAESSFGIQNGSLYAWGADNPGQLGIPSYYNSPFHSLVPVAVPGLSSGISDVSAGDFHTLAIQNGALYAWGDNSYGELGTTNGSLSPTRVPNLSNGVTSVAVGRYYSLAVANGAVYSWGADWHGQLGNGTTNLTPNPTPTVIPSLSTGVTAISTAGLDDTGSNSVGGADGTYYSHSLAIKNGAVYAWGSNEFGQLGNGSTTDSLVPVVVVGLSENVTSIAAGFRENLAVKNGNVYAWGTGYLGDGAVGTQLTPELIDASQLNNITAVATTSLSNFALASNGTVWAWGGNFRGELGLGSDSAYDYVSPQLLSPPTGYIFTSISTQADGDSVLATLAPVPEPAAISLLALSGITLLSRRRRSSRHVDSRFHQR